jgi:outer membrane receptor protein involved in Fe transport
LYGLQCGTPVPNWRHKLRGTYTVPTYWLDSTVTASAAWRYISAVRADSLSSPNNADSRLPSFSYLDLTASISFKGAYTFRVGVNNVLDKDPPIIGTGSLPSVFGNGNTFPQVYDSLGRYAFAGVTVDF